MKLLNIVLYSALLCSVPLRSNLIHSVLLKCLLLIRFNLFPSHFAILFLFHFIPLWYFLFSSVLLYSLDIERQLTFSKQCCEAKSVILLKPHMTADAIHREKHFVLQ
jgi:hypothetical protein